MRVLPRGPGLSTVSGRPRPECCLREAPARAKSQGGPGLNTVSQRLRPEQSLRETEVWRVVQAGSEERGCVRLQARPPRARALELSPHPSRCRVTSLVTQSCKGMLRGWICVHTHMCKLHVHTNLGVYTHIHVCLYTCMSVTPVPIYIK